MTIVSEKYCYVVGVDTHAQTHTYAVLTSSGVQLGTRQFPADQAGFGKATAWVNKQTGSSSSVLWVVEGVGSYGAHLGRKLADDRYEVVEAARVETKQRHGKGKSDPLDAWLIASSVLHLNIDRLTKPRADKGIQAGLKTLLMARNHIQKTRTAHINVLTALVRTSHVDVDARKSLSAATINQIAGWRSRKEPIENQIARQQSIWLAKQIIELGVQANIIKTTIETMIKQSLAAPLLDLMGIGPIIAATVLTVWSYPGRIRNQAAFSAIAGVNPIPASSGNKTRHRLNRGGDRQLNKALHMAIVTKMARDPETKTYTQKRKELGQSKKEIRRSLKRYLARQLYKTLNQLYQTQTTT